MPQHHDGVYAILHTVMGQIRRFGMVIGIRPEKLAEYQDLHADHNAGVRDLLSSAHMRNFSIYLQEFPDGNHYLFGYYEYDGDDYEADMARLAAEPRNQELAGHLRPDADPVPGRAHLETDAARLLPNLSGARRAPAASLPRPASVPRSRCARCALVVLAARLTTWRTREIMNRRFRADVEAPVSCALPSGESLCEVPVSIRCVGNGAGSGGQSEDLGGTALSWLASLT